MYGCKLSAVGTDTLVLKQQDISIHNADKFGLHLTSFVQLIKVL